MKFRDTVHVTLITTLLRRWEACSLLGIRRVADPMFSRGTYDMVTRGRRLIYDIRSAIPPYADTQHKVLQLLLCRQTRFHFIPLTGSVCPWSLSKERRVITCHFGSSKRLASVVCNSGATNQANNTTVTKRLMGCKNDITTQPLKPVVPSSEESEYLRLYQLTASTVYAHRCHFQCFAHNLVAPYRRDGSLLFVQLLNRIGKWNKMKSGLFQASTFAFTSSMNTTMPVASTRSLRFGPRFGRSL